ncbi:MAG: helix-turn-helix transcriptional regulator [Terracidiphilus sp.]
MRELGREIALRNLERQLRPYRKALKNRRPSVGWLRAMRQALAMPADDIARYMNLSPKMVFQLERSEEKKTITLKRLEEMARAMKCDLVYAIVPWERSLIEIAEAHLDCRVWKKRLTHPGW